jgi:hypothetical protein
MMQPVSAREQVKAEAAAGLRVALLSIHSVGDAVRACWYRNPSFASALMVESLRLRFGEGCDVRLITAFVARIRAAQGGPPGAFPSREAEALIRAYLGELALLDAVDPATFSYPDLGIAVLDRLFEEWQPTAAEVSDLFDRTAAVQHQMTVLLPELELAEEGWFAAGLPDSPLAAPSATWVPRDDEKAR